MDAVGGGRSILRLFEDTFSLSNAKAQVSFSQSGTLDRNSGVHPFHRGGDSKAHVVGRVLPGSPPSLTCYLQKAQSQGGWTMGLHPERCRPSELVVLGVSVSHCCCHKLPGSTDYVYSLQSWRF